eukprot:6001569-Pyramimonas_sp.AAC.1
MKPHPRARGMRDCRARVPLMCMARKLYEFRVIAKVDGLPPAPIFEDCERFENLFGESRFSSPAVDHGAFDGAILRAVAAAQLSNIWSNRRPSGQ